MQNDTITLEKGLAVCYKSNASAFWSSNFTHKCSSKRNENTSPPKDMYMNVHGIKAKTGKNPNVPN